MNKKLMLLFFVLGVFFVMTGAVLSKYNFFMLLEHNIVNEKNKLIEYVDFQIKENGIEIEKDSDLNRKIQDLYLFYKNDHIELIKELDIKLEKYNYEVEGYNNILEIFPNNKLSNIFGFNKLNKIKLDRDKNE